MLLAATPSGLVTNWSQQAALASMVLAIVVAAFNVRKFWRERNNERRDELLKAAGVDVQNESVTVASSERAILVMDKALAGLQSQREADQRAYATELQSLRDRLRATTAEHEEQLRRCQTTQRTLRSEHARCAVRVQARDVVIQRLNDLRAMDAIRHHEPIPRRLIMRADDDHMIMVDTAREEAELSTCPVDPNELPDHPGPSGIDADPEELLP